MSKVNNLVVRGDSWFSVPAIPPNLTNIIEVLGRFPLFTDSHDNQRYFLVYQHAAKGTTLRDMVNTEKGNHNIEKVFIKHRSRGNKVKALLLAGGGNDFLNKFNSLLDQYQQGRTGKNAFNEDRMEKFIEKLKGYYQYFIDLCNSDEYNCKVVTLSYSYPSPQKGGLLGEILTGKGYNTVDIRKKICKSMIDDYFVGALLENLVNKNKKRFYYVSSHELVGPGEYIDEIHLNPKGCRIVAQAIKGKLNEIFFTTNNAPVT